MRNDIVTVSQHVLIFSVSQCVNKNAWNIKSRTESDTFCHYCTVCVSRVVFKVRVYGYENNFTLQINYAMRHASVDALWSSF